MRSHFTDVVTLARPAMSDGSDGINGDAKCVCVWFFKGIITLFGICKSSGLHSICRGWEATSRHPFSEVANGPGESPEWPRARSVTNVLFVYKLTTTVHTHTEACLSAPPLFAALVNRRWKELSLRVPVGPLRIGEPSVFW